MIRDLLKCAVLLSIALEVVTAAFSSPSLFCSKLPLGHQHQRYQPNDPSVVTVSARRRISSLKNAKKSRERFEKIFESNWLELDKPAAAGKPKNNSNNDSNNEESPLSYAEMARSYRRTLYDPEDWLTHRSSRRFMRNLLTTFQSGVSRQLAKELSLVALVGLIIVLWNTIMIQGWDDFYFYNFLIDHNVDSLHLHHHDGLWPTGPAFCLPNQPFTLSSPALGLLLVFRTNASYSRWLDGRKAWGSIVNNCRSVLRNTFTWVGQPQNQQQEDSIYSFMSVNDVVSGTTRSDDLDQQQQQQEQQLVLQKKLERLAAAVWLVPRSLKRHLYREAEDGDDYIRDVTDKIAVEQNNPALAQSIIEARHKPTRALFELSQAIEDLPLHYLRRIEIEKGVIELCNACGACERISNSPVPLLYSRHTARFLTSWLLLLPLCLYNTFADSWNHVNVIPASLLIAFFFFGIEELAVQLEEPFTILPLQKITDGIELSAKEHLEWGSTAAAATTSTNTPLQTTTIPTINGTENQIKNKKVTNLQHQAPQDTDNPKQSNGYEVSHKQQQKL